MPDPSATDRRIWLVAGLGNPGPQYEYTPHNIGFLVVDRLAERHSIRITRKDAMALVGYGRVSGEETFLAKPQTFMNHSGESVKSFVTKYELEPKDELIVIYDEVALPWTGLRIRKEGSAGGHNGMKSVIRCLGHQNFVRVRVGIAPDHPIRDLADYVLAPFKRAQLAELEELLDYTAEAVESIMTVGAEKAMTRYNRRAQGDTKEEE